MKLMFIEKQDIYFEVKLKRSAFIIAFTNVLSFGGSDFIAVPLDTLFLELKTNQSTLDHLAERLWQRPIDDQLHQ